mmetsp:Transcript_24583/g.52133  ORF Transcript_24583/g.52133 Transcript_24583/m.52133 type:complete len:398 (-) Transcript_24583:1740-2933(-)
MDQEISCIMYVGVSSSAMITLVPLAEALAWMCPLHPFVGWVSRRRQMELALDLASFLTICTTPPKETFLSAPRLTEGATSLSPSLLQIREALSVMASAAPALVLVYSLGAIVSLFSIAISVRLLSRTLTMKPLSECRRLCPMSIACTMVVPLVALFFVLMIVLFYLRSKADVSLGNSLHPKLKMLSGPQMAPRLLSCANMELSLPTVNSSSCAPSVIQFVSNLVHGMSAHLGAQVRNSLFTPHFTMSSIVFLLEILVLSEHWTILFMPQELLKINCSASTGKLGQESSALIQLRLVSSLLWRTRSMDKLCTWSNTAVSVAVRLLPTYNRRAFLRWHSTLFAIHRPGSVLLLLVETLRLPWRVHFLSNNSKEWMARRVMFGVNSAVKHFAKETIRLWR